MIRGERMTETVENIGEFAYMFEAKGIQRYIFHSGKLRDVVGASDLVAGLARSDTKDEIGKFTAGMSFSRRAGGAFCVHADTCETLAVLRTKWRFHVMTTLPGLEFADAIERGDGPIQAMRACFKAMGGIRHNGLADALPLGRPVTKVAQLTGMPVVRTDHDDDLDLVASVQRGNAKGDRVGDNFLAARNGFKFPRRLDDDDVGDGGDNPAFPFKGEDKRIAVIHADLSGLGQMFRNMGKSYNEAEENLALAGEIEAAIAAAVKSVSMIITVECDEDGVLPARPILMGGDDITLIIRADLAIRYVTALLVAIEWECAPIGLMEGQPALSACAGVAIVGKGTPFLTAYKLANSMCDHAKSAAKGDGLVKVGGRDGYPSAFSFHVYQHTAKERYDTHVAVAEVDADGAPFSANPYFVGARIPENGAQARQLISIAAALANMESGHNRVREIKSLLAGNAAQAGSAWSRWQEWAKRRDPQGMKPLTDALGINETASLPESPTALYDAMTLVALNAVEAAA